MKDTIAGISTCLVFLLVVVGATGGSDLSVKKPARVSPGLVPPVVSSRKVVDSKHRPLQSPGTVLDSTYWDWQANGGYDDHLVMHSEYPAGGVCAVWTGAYQKDLSDRKLHYVNCWMGDGSLVRTMFHVSSFGMVSLFDELFVLCTDYDPDGQGTRAYKSMEAFPCIDTHVMYFTSPDTIGILPRITNVSDSSIVITGISVENFHNVTSGVMWARAPDGYSGFGGWHLFSDLAPDWMDDDMEPPTIHSGSNGKVGVVIPDYAGSVRLFESTDYGETFEVVEVASADTADLSSGLDSTAARLGWINSDITYVGDEPHIVWSAGQGVRAMQDYFLLDFKSTIFHWSPSTGIDTVVVASTQSADPSRDDYVPTPWNHLSVDWPSIGLAVDGRSLVVAYTALSTEDIDSTAIPATGHLDIWMTSSSDNGETWTDAQNVTNPDGTVLGWDDRYPSVAKVNIDNAADPGKDVYMIYQSDDLAGTYVMGTEGALNMDYVKFLGVDLAAVGIGGEGASDHGPAIPRVATLLQNYPNPFNPSTTIGYQVVDRSRVTIEVYDLRGHRLTTIVDEERGPGRYSAHWDGRNNSGRRVPTGTYLYRMKIDNIPVSTKKMLVLK